MLWGVATSAYQIEGAPENDWTEWEAEGGLKEPGVRCGRATPAPQNRFLEAKAS